jgi:hypothetical protein
VGWFENDKSWYTWLGFWSANFNQNLLAMLALKLLLGAIIWYYNFFRIFFTCLRLIVLRDITEKEEDEGLALAGVRRLGVVVWVLFLSSWLFLLFGFFPSNDCFLKFPLIIRSCNDITWSRFLVFIGLKEGEEKMPLTESRAVVAAWELMRFRLPLGLVKRWVNAYICFSEFYLKFVCFSDFLILVS